MKTNCAGCGEVVDTDIHPDTPEGTMCFDCHFDYFIAKGGYGANVCL